MSEQSSKPLVPLGYATPRPAARVDFVAAGHYARAYAIVCLVLLVIGQGLVRYTTANLVPLGLLLCGLSLLPWLFCVGLVLFALLGHNTDRRPAVQALFLLLVFLVAGAIAVAFHPRVDLTLDLR